MGDRDKYEELTQEIERLKAEKRYAFCLYCQYTTEVDEEKPEIAYRELIDHDQSCPNNPLIARIKELEKRVK